MAAMDPGERVTELPVIVFEKVESTTLKVKAPAYGNSGRAIRGILGHIDPLVGRHVRACEGVRRSCAKESDNDLVHQVRPESVRIVQSEAVRFLRRYCTVIARDIAAARESTAAGIVIHISMSKDGLL